MKLYFENDAKELKTALQSGCRCKRHNGENEPCTMYNGITCQEMKVLMDCVTVFKNADEVSTDWIDEQIDRIAMEYIAAHSKINMPHPSNSNRVFRNEFDGIPLSSYEIAAIAKSNTTAKDFEKGGRLDGDLCYCLGNGEFVISKDNVEGDKVFMQCRKCGGYSHL